VDVFKLWAAISLDTSDYENQLNDAGKETDSFSEKLQSGLSTAAKVATAAITAATTAVTALTKSAIDNYADYEQLVGGVETLFGDSANAILGYANNAYKTAGLSANDYMETVTSFSASLLQSLDNDTAAAAEKADLAITDMSDNANKMGTSMESIQNAYQGFAKQNYTMLDNLKLGYGGTKEEMERLLEDATALSGVEYDIESYADIVDAIHVVQTEMGITGTTALEASTTISGSIATMKSAWTNFLTGLGSEDADMGELFDELLDSVEVVGTNVIPVAQQILTSIGSVIQEQLPGVVAQVPGILADLVPQLVTTGASLLSGVASGIGEAVPDLLATVPEIISQLITTVSESLPDLINSIGAMVTDAWPTIKAAGKTMLGGIADAIPDVLDFVLTNLPSVITGISDFLVAAVPKIVSAASTLLSGMIHAIPPLLELLAEKLPSIVTAILTALANGASAILQGAIDLLYNIVLAIADIAPDVKEAIPKIIDGIVTGVKNGIPAVKTAITDLVNKITTIFSEPVNNAKTWAKDMIDNFIQGIKDKISAVGDAVSNVASKITSVLGFSLPDEGPLADADTYMPDFMHLLAQGISNNTDEVLDEASSLADAMASTLNSDYASSISAATVSSSSNGTTSQIETLNANFAQLFALLQQYLPQMANMQVVLDDGTLVGSIAGSMDAALGKQLAYAGRGN